MKRLLFAAVVLAWTMETAHADPLTDDLRCFVVTLQLMGSKDANQKMVGMMAHSYWLGRLDGRAPDLDLENRVIAELPLMTKPEMFRAEALRCGEIMTARGNAETKMGEDMQKRGAEIQKLQDAR